MKVSQGCGKTQSVGHGLFWQHFLPSAQMMFPNQLRDVGFDEFYLAINSVKPSLIRVEADELTYNLHIMIRFEIELDLIEGRIKVENLPAIWNQKIQDYLGITPDSDANGGASRCPLVIRRHRVLPNVYTGQSLCCDVFMNKPNKNFLI